VALNPNSMTESHPQNARTSVPAFCVGFYFAARAITTVILVRVMDMDPQAGTAAALASNLLMLAFVCLSELGTIKDDPCDKLDLASIRWVFLYLALSCCSLLWSASISPSASAAHWLGTASDVAIAILLLRRDASSTAASSMMDGFICGACFIAITAWLLPTQSDLRIGDEDYMNPNTVGNLCAFAIFFAQYRIRSGRVRWGIAIFFMAITLVRTLSKTAIIAFVLSEGYLILRDRVLTRSHKIYLALAVLIVIFAFWGLFEAYFDFYTTYGNQSVTFTGRTAIWVYAAEAAIEKPWIGYGLDSMWKVVPAFGTFEARHAENEILEQLYSYGALGLVMLCALYGSVYRRFRALAKGPLRMTIAGLLSFVLIRGLAEAETFDLLLPLWSIVLIASLVARTNRAERGIKPASLQPDLPLHLAFKPISEMLSTGE
jgi:exopolysaccharide production protein ExoQ